MTNKPISYGRRMEDRTDHHEYVSHLDSRVTHLDNRVSLIEQHTASIIAKLDSLSSSFEAVSQRVLAPVTTNWSGLVATCVSVLTAVGTIGYLSLSPIQREVQDHHEIIAAIPANVVKVNRNENDLQDVMLRLRLVEAKQAEDAVRARAIGDYLKTVDEHGSRRWIADKAAPNN